MAKGEGCITSGDVETRVEAFQGSSIVGEPPFKKEYGPLKEPGSDHIPVVTGAKPGAKKTNTYTQFVQGRK